MKDSPEISVIIPVYQAADSLQRSVDSVLNQNFTDFEILLINDGSQDNSGEICNAYAEKHTSISVLHQENAGPSAARNAGLDLAKGEFVTFVDADDYAEPSFLEAFFALEKQPKNSVVQQGHFREEKDGGFQRFDFPDADYEKPEIPKAFADIELVKRGRYVWTKLFDLSIIRNNNLKFDTSIDFGEDLNFILDYLNYTERFICVNKNYFYHAYSPKSLSNSYNPYEEVVHGMHKITEKFKKLYTTFDFDETTKKINNYYLPEYYIRALKALYLNQPRRKKRERLKILKKDGQSEFRRKFLKAFQPENASQKLIKFFVSHRQFHLLDRVMVLWAGLQSKHRSP